MFLFSQSSRKKLTDLAQSLPPSSQRAQCYHLAQLQAGLSIAETIASDHATDSGALRAARLVVDAGAATEDGATEFSFGTFTFEDGSQLSC
jgi:hypothetical protein